MCILEIAYENEIEDAVLVLASAELSKLNYLSSARRSKFVLHKSSVKKPPVQVVLITNLQKNLRS